MTNIYRLNVYTNVRCCKWDSKRYETAKKNFDFYAGNEGVLKAEIIDRRTNEVLEAWEK